MPMIEVFADTRGRARCRGCHAPITWAQVVRSGRKMCFDGEPVALSTRHDEDRRLIEVLDLEANHCKSCVDAASFKR